jgi:hypothetical protein
MYGDEEKCLQLSIQVQESQRVTARILGLNVPSILLESYRDRNPDVVADKVHQLVQLLHGSPARTPPTPENPIEGHQMLFCSTKASKWFS